MKYIILLVFVCIGCGVSFAWDCESYKHTYGRLSVQANICHQIGSDENGVYVEFKCTGVKNKKLYLDIDNGEGCCSEYGCSSCNGDYERDRTKVYVTADKTNYKALCWAKREQKEKYVWAWVGVEVLDIQYDNVVTVDGVITNYCTGDKIIGASIALHDTTAHKSTKTISDLNGYYARSVFAPFRLNLKATKQGYVDYDGWSDLWVMDKTINVVLKPEGGCPITEEETVCATDVKECPDGSFVKRNKNNNCQFKECPKEIIIINDTLVINDSIDTPIILPKSESYIGAFFYTIWNWLTKIFGEFGTTSFVSDSDVVYKKGGGSNE